jgi:hypothetical protein
VREVCFCFVRLTRAVTGLSEGQKVLELIVLWSDRCSDMGKARDMQPNALRVHGLQVGARLQFGWLLDLYRPVTSSCVTDQSQDVLLLPPLRGLAG